MFFHARDVARDILRTSDGQGLCGRALSSVPIRGGTRRRKPAMKSLLFVVAIATCAASPALAQDQTSPQSSPQNMQNMHSEFMDACGNDMKTYCASAQSRDERRSCVMANKDKFSDTCKTFMASHPMHQHPTGMQHPTQMQGQPPGN
jgi:hypothetical protein